MTDKLHMVIFEIDSSKNTFTFKDILLYINTNKLHESCKSLRCPQNKKIKKQLRANINDCMIKIKSGFQKNELMTAHITIK